MFGRIFICAVLLSAFHLSLFTSLVAQNYSTGDTVTEYPNKGTFYHDKFEGRKTASGEVFDQNAFTAAHWRIKLGTYIMVTNQNTGLQVIVKVNDRCPKHGVIDLSRRAATAIGIRGCQPVTVRLLPEGYEQRCMEQDSQFDSVHSRLRPKPQPAATPLAEPTSVHHTEEHYNLTLCSVASHGEAYGSIQKLPAKYQGKALVETTDESGDLRISLDVRLPKSEAEALRLALADKFPQAVVVPAQ